MNVTESAIETEAIERQLDRIQSFIPRIDTRVGAYIAILSAQIAVAALNLSVPDLKSTWMILMVIFYLGSCGWAFLNLYMCTHPNLDGGESSLVYFAEIVKLDEAVYVEKFASLDDVSFRTDLTKQIYRNSQIVNQKYSHLSKAGTGLLVGMIPWTLILVGTSIANGSIPALNN